MNNINNSECLNEFGKYIRGEREKLGLSQSEVAKTVGITQTYYSRLELGERNIDLVLAMRICSALNLSMNTFVNRYI